MIDTSLLCAKSDVCILDRDHIGTCLDYRDHRSRYGGPPSRDYLAEAERASGPYDDGGQNSTPARIDRALRLEALRLAVLRPMVTTELAKTTVSRASTYYEFLNGRN